jgi:hypothetical protein
MYEHKKDSKEASNMTSLQVKNVHSMMLIHSLQKQTKDDDVLCRKIAKKCKDIEVSQKVGAITAGLMSKQMNINNGQFNAH